MPATTTASPPAPAAATVVVLQAELGGRGFYTEGAYAFVEIRTAGGLLVSSVQTDRYHLAQELLRTHLASGEYALLTYVRPCEAACPAMDAPTDQCETTFNAGAAGSIVITVRRSVGQACSLELTGA
jgi:hypothetical protein